MKINSQETAFKSGLTFSIIKDMHFVNVGRVEADLQSLGVDANFKGSKSIAGMTILAANILSDISAKFHLPFEYLPPSIRVYKKSEISTKDLKDTVGFCIEDTKAVIKGEKPYIGTSVFMNKLYNKLFYCDMSTSMEYMDCIRSSSHFLSNIMHELFHSIHMNLIYSKYGYEGSCPILLKNYGKEGGCGIKIMDEMENNNFNGNVKAFAQSYLGKYAKESNSYLEIFAELMTKLVTESIDKKCMPIKNPMDLLPKKCPKEIKQMLDEVL